jgi:nucleoid DNA-binding protein
MSLTKTQLIKKIAHDTQLSHKTSHKILTVMLDIIMTALAKDDIISIRGFGKFYSTSWKERKIRHPSTGQIILIGPKKTVRFKSFKYLCEQINGFEFDTEEFIRQNRKILQKLFDLIENSGDYQEEENIV